MENRKIGNSQAIAFIAIITINHFLLNISYSIIGETKSAAILNTIYIGIIAIILAYIISKLLSKFPTYDILDISNYLMGKAFKTIIGVLFLAYFIFFSGILLYNFSSALKFIYFPNTDVVYIIIFFLLAATFVAMLKNNAVYKNSVIILPIMIISIVALFIFSITNVKMTNMYPILGEGIYNTFFLGISNLFAFQGLAYLYFLPSQLNSPKELTKISITALVVSAIFALITITIL